MEGAFLVRYHFLLLSPLLIPWQHVNLIAKLRKPFGTLTVSFHRSLTVHSKLKLRSGIYATSRHIPGVRFAGVTHPGLIGTAPSAELLATWNKREGELIAAHANAVPPVAFPPEPIGAYVGQSLEPEVKEKIANEGARTVPGREHGGNCDVRHILLQNNFFLFV